MLLTVERRWLPRQLVCLGRTSTRLAGPLPLRDRALRVSEAHPGELSQPVQRRQVPRERVHLLVVERQAACERTLKGGVHMADEQRCARQRVQLHVELVEHQLARRAKLPQLWQNLPFKGFDVELEHAPT